MKILRTASLGSNFTGSYKKKSLLRDKIITAHDGNYMLMSSVYLKEMSLVQKTKVNHEKTASEIAEQI